MAELRALAQDIGMDAPSSSAGPDPNQVLEAMRNLLEEAYADKQLLKQSMNETNRREKEARAKSAAGPGGGGEPPDDDDADSSDSD
eukprot:3812205-Karenia_brevis.AAC.1